jgi:hypothetical protein
VLAQVGTVAPYRQFVERDVPPDRSIQYLMFD